MQQEPVENDHIINANHATDPDCGYTAEGCQAGW